MTLIQARLYLALLGTLTITIALFISTAIEQSGEFKHQSAVANNTKTRTSHISEIGGTKQENKFPVLHVVDGDTIDVLINGNKERVRLIGINTPETVDTKRPVQCYGPEASKHMHELLDGKEISLESDNTQGNHDKYGRLLRYVSLDTLDVNAEQIRSGYAYEYTYQHNPYTHQNIYKQLQDEAHQSGRGLWSVATCNGKL